MQLVILQTIMHMLKYKYDTNGIQVLTRESLSEYYLVMFFLSYLVDIVYSSQTGRSSSIIISTGSLLLAI